MPPPVPLGPLRSEPELEQLLGPIALYPDPLISELLPASTQPAQIVQAERYLAGGGDPNAIDFQPWDSSVKALAHYAEVLKWMDDNLNWTAELGQAFLTQPDEVMNVIQHLRAQAASLGNLANTPQANVVNDEGSILILPTDPNLIYVPMYDPAVVYYQRPYGQPFITFGFGFGIGLWLHHDFDWRERRLVVWNHDHPRPSDWWTRGVRDHRREEFHQLPAWNPRNRGVVVAPGRGDRGWSPPPQHPVTPQPRPVMPGHNTRPEPPRTAPPKVVPHAPITVRPQTGPLIGIHNAQQARQFSERGQQSRQAPPVAPRTAPPTPAPAPHPTSPPPSNPGPKEHHK